MAWDGNNISISYCGKEYEAGLYNENGIIDGLFTELNNEFENFKQISKDVI